MGEEDKPSQVRGSDPFSLEEPRPHHILLRGHRTPPRAAAQECGCGAYAHQCPPPPVPAPRTVTLTFWAVLTHRLRLLGGEILGPKCRESSRPHSGLDRALPQTVLTALPEVMAGPGTPGHPIRSQGGRDASVQRQHTAGPWSFPSAPHQPSAL